MAQYADIVEVAAPGKAVAGDTVIVDVSVKNIGSIDKYIAVTAAYDSSALSFQFDYLLVAPGQTVIMRGWFTMPSTKVRVTLWSWYWDGSTWQIKDKGDDTAFIDIALAAESVPEFSEMKISNFIKV